MLINFNNEENSQQSSENDFFLQIASLSQANKLKGLKLMIAVFKESSK